MFERLAKRGIVAARDPPLTAAQFNWLIMSALPNRAILLGDDAIRLLESFRDTHARGAHVFGHILEVISARGVTCPVAQDTAMLTAYSLIF